MAKVVERDRISASTKVFICSVILANANLYFIGPCAVVSLYTSDRQLL